MPEANPLIKTLLGILHRIDIEGEFQYERRQQRYFDDYRLETNIPCFNGYFRREKFLNWISELEQYVARRDIQEDEMVEFIAFKLKKERLQHGGINCKGQDNGKVNLIFIHGHE